MKETYGTLVLPIFADTPSTTSSPGSAAGATPCGWRAGKTTVPAGRDPAHASLSPRQAREAGLLTSATSGRTGSGSQASRTLTSSLANRLHQLMDSTGSILYRLIWRSRVTPWRRRIFALRGSARRTSASACSSWPSPKAANRSGASETATREGTADLQTVASWASPLATDDRSTSGGRGREQNPSLRVQALSAGWPSPQSRDGEHGNGQQERALEGIRKNLDDFALLAAWPSPQARDYKSGQASEETAKKNSRPLSEVAVSASGASSTGSPAATRQESSGGQLNAAFSLWLQGYPSDWLMAAPARTVRGRRSSKG